MRNLVTADFCRFCSIVNGIHFNGIADKPIYETTNYIVIPSIGAFIYGWVMIVPKKHVNNMSNFYEDDEFLKLIIKIYNYVDKKFGKPVMFEHGASCDGVEIGCGVDHAHFHIVPFTGSLLEEIKKTKLYWQKCVANQISIKSSNCDYLFYCEAPPNHNILRGYLHVVEKPTSQFFRKMLAKKTKNEHICDYKEYPLLDETYAVVPEFQDLK